MTHKKVPYFLLLAIAFLLNPPQALAYAKKQEPYETVNKFCSKKNETKAREFCLRALKSDPRSATAEDNVALLFISDDLAIKRLNKTRDYIVSSYKKEGPKSNLKECLDAYRWGIGELQAIPEEFKQGPLAASYDALMASDAMYRCKDSLEKHKISDPYVLGRHRIDLAYVRLCVDTTMTVG